MRMTVERSLSIDAPVSRVWEVVGALDEYHSHANTLTETVVVSGEGEGAIRHCVDNSGNGWNEMCTIWDPGRQFGFEVDVSTYPLRYRMLFRAFRGTWRVDPADGGAMVTVRFDADVRQAPGASFLARVFAERVEPELESILESYRTAAEGMGSDTEDRGEEVGEYRQSE